MKVSITRKDGGSQERECVDWEVRGTTLGLYDGIIGGVGKCDLTYACTDWLECEVVDE